MVANEIFKKTGQTEAFKEEDFKDYMEVNKEQPFIHFKTENSQVL
jgi:hypothetical protein